MKHTVCCVGKEVNWFHEIGPIRWLILYRMDQLDDWENFPLKTDFFFSSFFPFQFINPGDFHLPRPVWSDFAKWLYTVCFIGFRQFRYIYPGIKCDRGNIFSFEDFTSVAFYFRIDTETGRIQWNTLYSVCVSLDSASFVI